MKWLLKNSNNELEKVIQFEWLEVPIALSYSSLVELGIVWTIDHNSSWIKMILKSEFVSKMISTRTLFFQKFWENSLIFLIIISIFCSQLSKLIAS